MSDWVHRTLPTEVRQLLLLAMAPWCQQVHVPEPIKILDIQHLEWGTRILFSTGEHRVSLGIFWGGNVSCCWFKINTKSLPGSPRSTTTPTSCSVDGLFAMECNGELHNLPVGGKAGSTMKSWLSYAMSGWDQLPSSISHRTNLAQGPILNEHWCEAEGNVEKRSAVLLGWKPFL